MGLRLENTMQFTTLSTVEQSSVIQTGSTGRDDLRPGSLNPAWITEGNPVARTLPLTDSADQAFSSGLWDSTAGKFKFIYDCDEIVHILEGEVTVQEAGKVHVLRAGDVAFFPAGLTTYWTVPTYVKKFCIFRSIPLSWGARMKRMIRRILGRS